MVSTLKADALYKDAMAQRERGNNWVDAMTGDTAFVKFQRASDLGSPDAALMVSRRLWHTILPLHEQGSNGWNISTKELCRQLEAHLACASKKYGEGFYGFALGHAYGIWERPDLEKVRENLRLAKALDPDIDSQRLENNAENLVFKWQDVWDKRHPKTLRGKVKEWCRAFKADISKGKPRSKGLERRLL